MAEMDYKTPRVTYNDNGTVTVFVRFYAGVLEERLNDEGVLETRYWRDNVVVRPTRDINSQLARIGRASQVGDGWEITFRGGVDVADTLRRVLGQDATRTPINTGSNDRVYDKPERPSR